MSDGLDVWVVDLERAVMYAGLLRVLGEEEGVVIHPFFLPVYVHESSNRHTIWGRQQICGLEVEVFGIKTIGGLKAGNQSTKRRTFSRA